MVRHETVQLLRGALKEKGNWRGQEASFTHLGDIGSTTLDGNSSPLSLTQTLAMRGSA